MGKAKAKVKVLSTEQKEAKRQAKINKLKELQSNREKNKYTKLLKGAENRLKRAEDYKVKAVREVEEAMREHREAEVYLNQVAEEVVAWENHGVLVETAFTDLEVGDKVVVAHEGSELGVKLVTDKIDSELIYGTVLTKAAKGYQVKVQKVGFDPVDIPPSEMATGLEKELDDILQEDWSANI